MSVEPDPASRSGQIAKPPSIVDLAAQALRRKIIGGELVPGDRVVESRLTTELGVSRSPLREAMRTLENEGLIRQSPHRGSMVTPLTLHDIYEIVTFRRELERMAITLGVPVTDTSRLQRCHDALTLLENAAERNAAAELNEASFEFHTAVVGLAGHRRLESAYRSLQLQMLLCMSMNQNARVQRRESLIANALRHRHLLTVIKTGDVTAVLKELEQHGDRTFLMDLPPSLEDGSTQAREWWEAQYRQDGR